MLENIQAAAQSSGSAVDFSAVEPTPAIARTEQRDGVMERLCGTRSRLSDTKPKGTNCSHLQWRRAHSGKVQITAIAPPAVTSCIACDDVPTAFMNSSANPRSQRLFDRFEGDSSCAFDTFGGDSV